MNISADGDWSVHMLDICLLDQDLPRLQTEIASLLFADLLALMQQLNLSSVRDGATQSGFTIHSKKEG